jgi:hypothetical protein
MDKLHALQFVSPVAAQGGAAQLFGTFFTDAAICRQVSNST